MLNPTKKAGMKKLIIFLVISLFFINISPAGADTAAEQFSSGINSTAAGAGYNSADAENPEGIFVSTVAGFIKLLLSLVGLIFLVLMIYGGYRWMAARGNDAEVNQAKSIIINASIGLIVVMAAYAFTLFVGNLVTDINRPPAEIEEAE